MRCFFPLFLAVVTACTPATGKVSMESESAVDAEESGADEDMIDAEATDDEDDEGGDEEGGADGEDDEGGDTDEETDDEDGLAEGWERVPGWSLVTDGVIFDIDQEVWLFSEDITDSFSAAKDGHGEEEREAGPACVLTSGEWEPICVAFIGESWGAVAALDPEASCAEFGDEDDGDWHYTEEGCNVDAKAVCLLHEGTTHSMKTFYYNPMPLSTAEESCVDEGGSFYALATDEEDEGEEEYDLGTRWVGFVLMDNSFGTASFEHFTESGENCKANAEMRSIEDEEPCADCEFAKSFKIGEFRYEIDEGGCPRDELADTEGLTVTFGHGTSIIFEDGDTVFHSLMYQDTE